MPASNPIVPKDGTILLNDATGTPLAYTVIYEDGDIKITGLTKDQKRVQAFFDRGALYALREVDDIEAVEIEFTAHFIQFTDAALATLADALLKRGPVWAAGVSTLGAAYGGGSSGVWCIKITWSAERSDYGATADTSLAFLYFHPDSVDVAEGVPGKFTVKGRAFRPQHDTANWLTAA